MQDVSIEYSDRMRIVALFDRTDEEIKAFENEIAASAGGTLCKHI